MFNKLRHSSSSICSTFSKISFASNCICLVYSKICNESPRYTANHSISSPKPLTAGKLTQKKTGLSALTDLKDYDPQRKDYGPTKLATVNKTLADAETAEITAKNAYEKAHDAHVAAQWSAWNFYQGAAESVVGQYGSDSDEYASLGYKKKSEYKKTAPGTKAAKKAAAKQGGA